MSKRSIQNMTMLVLAGALSSCSSNKSNQVGSNASLADGADREPAANLRKYDLLRGNPAEYDPGAPSSSKWAELFASIPNYRLVGRQILGGRDEKFRWEMGPMWYRGRLGDNQVKVFVVGQEGAQDENVSNRAFTGSTGTKTQNFLNHIGIYRSYLFMNTFVYTIQGQLGDDPKFDFMEQGAGVTHPEMSPIVKYRHELFDHMLVTNASSIALFMGVGSGGKASLVTWINARGGKCSVVRDLANCNTTGMKEYFKQKFGVNIANQILAIGVPHPGGASAINGGTDALGNIIRGFTEAARRVAKFKVENRNWLTQDHDDPESSESRLAKMNANYVYRDAAVPYRDFAFGTNFRMGYDGTTSNRWKADSIQVFSKNGEYGDKTARYNLKKLGQGTFETSGLKDIGFVPGFDMPWEPPKYNGKNSEIVRSFDAGPCGEYDNYAFFKDKNYSQGPCKFAQLITSGWESEALAQSASFGPTSIYRGRLKGAELLVIADQTSHDDFFSGRALTGEMGQKLQTWLNSEKISKNYLIIRTSPFDALDESGRLNDAVLQRSKARLMDVIDEAFAQGSIKRVVSLGAFAKGIAEEAAKNKGMRAEVLDVSRLKASAIPRYDLPFHSRWWMGTTGDRALRGDGGTLKGTSDGAYHYYRIHAPDWNPKYPVPSLTPDVLNNITKALSEIK